jgi:hypothetical protein
MHVLIHVNAGTDQSREVALGRAARRGEAFGDHYMPFDGTSLPPNPAESSAELLARADRVRRHAWMFTGDLAERRLEQLADELEVKARQVGRPRI